MWNRIIRRLVLLLQLAPVWRWRDAKLKPPGSTRRPYPPEMPRWSAATVDLSVAAAWRR